MQGSQCFRLQVVTPEAVGQSVSMSLGTANLDGVLEEYYDFADVFSKYKASILAEHCPYNLKITLEEGASPPIGPIYLLSQEELLALHKSLMRTQPPDSFILHGLPTGCPYSSYGRRMARCAFVAISGESTGY